MTKEIVALDLETTGVDTTKDFIVQIGLAKFDSETFDIKDEFYSFIKPSSDYVIGTTASEVTGFTKEFIDENGVSLASVWPKILEFTDGCDILTYNGNKFDIPLLYNNLKRDGLEFDFKNRRFYDSMSIENSRYPMTLVGVYKRYIGKDYQDAHDALADVRATIEVFRAQQSVTMDDIEKEEFTLISPEGFVKRNEEGALIFTTGKYRKFETNRICEIDPSYIKWVFQTFSKDTCMAIKEEWYAAHPKQN